MTHHGIILMAWIVMVHSAVSCCAQEAKPMKKIEKTVMVSASAAEVWNVWTTSDGAATFFAPKASIELRLGGPFELYFAPEAPAGSRGSDGCTVLSFLPGLMISFTWNAPPRFPSVRDGGEHTFVVIRIEPVGEGGTKVTLTHLGWNQGGEWDQVYDYFQHAWDVVLGRLVHRFEKGPIDCALPFTPEAK